MNIDIRITGSGAREDVITDLESILFSLKFAEEGELQSAEWEIENIYATVNSIP